MSVVKAIAATANAGLYETDDITASNVVWRQGNNAGLPELSLRVCKFTNDRTVFATVENTTTDRVEWVCKKSPGQNWQTILTYAQARALISAPENYATSIRSVDADVNDSNVVAVYVNQPRNASYREVSTLYSLDGGLTWTYSVILYTYTIRDSGNIQVRDGMLYAGVFAGSGSGNGRIYYAPIGGSWEFYGDMGISSYSVEAQISDDGRFLHVLHSYSGYAKAIHTLDLKPLGSALLKSATGYNSPSMPAAAYFDDVVVGLFNGSLITYDNNYFLDGILHDPMAFGPNMVWRVPLSDNEVILAKLNETSNGNSLWYTNDWGLTSSVKSGSGATGIPGTAGGIVTGGLYMYIPYGDIYVRNTLLLSGKAEGIPMGLNTQGAFDVARYAHLHASDLTAPATDTQHHLPAPALKGRIAIDQGGSWQAKSLTGHVTMDEDGNVSLTEDYLTEAEHAAIGDNAPHHARYTDAEALAQAEAVLAAHTALVNPHGTAFTALVDAPGEYDGQAGRHIAVNATEDGLEFAPDTDAESILTWWGW